jgi:hypothetical protein
LAKSVNTFARTADQRVSETKRSYKNPADSGPLQPVGTAVSVAGKRDFQGGDSRCMRGLTERIIDAQDLLQDGLG